MRTWSKTAARATAALTLAACQKESVEFTISEGDHDGSPKSVVAMETDATFDRQLSFEAYFHGDTRYESVDPVNQYDWNKLMGLTSSDHQYNSIRLGWRYNPDEDAIDLGYYGYLNGVRQTHELATVALERWVPVTLRFSTTGTTATADGVSASEAGVVDTTAGGSTFIMQTAYFGGDEVAPHDIHIDVRNISE
jgi:hypothetical protein